MNKLAVMQGCYADFKLVKTRAQCQIVIEIPIEKAEQVISTFGIPQSGKETWLAIALIDQQAIEKPKRMGLSQQAALMATKPFFWQYIESIDPDSGEIIDSEELATQFIKEYCHIKSRTELDVEGNPANQFRRLQLSFQDYLDDVS